MFAYVHTHVRGTTVIKQRNTHTLFDHRNSACMCVHVREHTCDVNKDEPICSAKFEYSLRVCGYVKANVYVIVRDLDAMLEQGKG